MNDFFLIKAFVLSDKLDEAIISAINTLYNVCSVHRGMFSTSGVFSTSGGYHEYIGGIS